MNTKNIKETLKQYVAFSPRERRILLENFIDNEMYEEDILYAINYVQNADKNGNIHSVTKLSYNGKDFSISIEAGVTRMK